MKRLFSKELLIGFILLLSFAVLFVGIDYLKGINVFRAENIYKASFTDVTGLTIASPVTMNGMKVGQVVEMSYDYDNPGHVLVMLNMDKDFKITKGSQVVMATSILGTAELSLKMAPGTDYCSSYDVIEGSKAGDLMSDISHDVMPQVIEMLPRLNSIMAQVDTIVSNPALDNTVSRLDAVSRNLEVMSRNLAVTSTKINPVLTNAGDVVEDLTQVSADLKELSAQLKQLPLAETMDNVKTTTANLEQITSKVNSKDSSLGMLLNDKGLYEHIDKTIVSLDSIIVDLRLHPKRYVNFKLF